jgi:hypothetical protein
MIIGTRTRGRSDQVARWLDVNRLGCIRDMSSQPDCILVVSIIQICANG